MRWILLAVLVGCASGPDVGWMDSPSDDATTLPGFATEPSVQTEPAGPVIAGAYLPTRAGNYAGFCALIDGWVACRNRALPAWMPPAQPLVPPDSNDFVALRAGIRAMWGLRTDGTVTVWGDTSDVAAVLLDLPGVVDGAEAFAVGHNHACWISSGHITCYGHDEHGQVSGAPTSGGWVQVEADYNWTCALHETGALDCWGIADGEGVAYVAHRQVSDAPYDEPLVRIRQSGGDQLCGQRPDGVLTCWGDDSLGQATWATGRPADEWADGKGHVCAIHDGQTRCSGGYSTGFVPDMPFETLIGGPDYVCGLTKTTLWECWGDGATFSE